MIIKESKGFTLVEVLAVIVIVGILSTIGIVAVTKLVSKAREEEKNQQEKMLLLAAKSYYQDHRKELNTNSAPPTSICVKIGELKSKLGSYLNESVDKVNDNDCIIIEIPSQGKYEYSYKKGSSCSGC